MHYFGFNHQWLQLIEQCLSIVTYSILLNSSPHGLIKPCRGLRQGDPLSPFLFILASEVLSRLFSWEEFCGRLHRVVAARHASSITHLMFMDNLLIFCRANIPEARSINHLLDLYCSWTGQLINRRKSLVYYTPNTNLEVLATVREELQLKLMSRDNKYLGLPVFMCKDKVRNFAVIKERLNSKMVGWKSKILSQAGRTTLIKSVVTSLP